MTPKDELTANAGKVWPSVNMKCVLIEPIEGINPIYGGDIPKTGVVYTVRGLSNHELVDGSGIALEGVNSKSIHGGPFWPSCRFRPIVTKTQEQDLEAVFRPLLSIGNEELAADKQRVDELLMSLEAAWTAYPGEGE